MPPPVRLLFPLITLIARALRELRAAGARDALWPAAGQSRWVRLYAWLGLLSYAVLLLELVPLAMARVAGTGRNVPWPLFFVAVGLVHVAQVVRLVAAGRAWPERRRNGRVLIAVILLFNAGAMTLGALGGFDGSTEPELLMLPAYAVLAGFLLLDAPGRAPLSAGAVLDACVIGGAAACASATWLVTWVVDRLSDEHGPGLVLLVAYPSITIFLISWVLFQVSADRRAWSGQSLTLLCGLGVLGYADSVILRSEALRSQIEQVHVYPLFLATGLTLLTTAAGGPLLQPRHRSMTERSTLPPTLAALIPVAVLALAPQASLAILAVPTLVAVALRLALALRHALELSLTDDLTGLANRRAVLARAATADARDEAFGLLVADLDGFTRLNNTLGHEAGDDILRRLAQRLREGLPPGTLLARLGGDEFAVLGPIATPEAAHAEATRIRELIGRPIEILGHSVRMDAAIGMALRTAEPAASDLLRQADTAMYQAKVQHSGALMYRPDRDDFTADRLAFAEDLQAGLEEQIRTWYQPQVDAATRELVGLEALVRWDHPQRGILAPAHFLDVARQSGLMAQLTVVVLDTVLADVAALLAAGIRTRVSFNVAPAELLDESLLRRLLVAIEVAGLPAGTLTLEVTEDSLIADPERAFEALTTISAHGIEVSIDDYGSGYSSLAYLRDLPVRELKMDRSFVTAVAHDHRSRIIVESTSRMARGLGLRTVAEGIEDAGAADQLQRVGVDVLQGYHFARPMPLDAVRQWIAGRSPGALTSGSARGPAREI